MNLPPVWRQPAIAALLLGAILLAAQWPAASGMAELWWRSETFTHALLVPPISAWLIWRRRERLAALAPRPWWPGLLLLTAAVLLGLVGRLVEANVVQHFGVVLSLQALLLGLFGLQVARCIAFPLLFLLFAPPFGDFLMPPMMESTADFIVSALRLSGVPVYREGLHFVIPSGNWSVVEACSGIRYLFASFMVGTLFAYLNFAGWRSRLGFVLLSLAVPVFANWLRGYLIVMLGHYSDNRLATGADHLVYGWVFFGIIMAIMFWIGGRWADAVAGPVADEARPAGPAAGSSSGATTGSYAAFALTAALLLWLPAHWAAGLRQPPAGELPPLALAGIAPQSDWQRVDGDNPDWAPSFVGADQKARTLWRGAADGPPITLDLGFYRAQREEAKAVSSSNTLVESKDSRWAARGSSQLQRDDGLQRQSRWMQRQGGVDAPIYLARRLYWVDGQFTSSDREAKLLGLRQLLAGRGDAQAVIVWQGAEAGDGEQRLDRFWRDIRTPLNERLKQLAAESRGHNPGR